MKTLNETYKATFSNGNTETVSAWNELQAKQYFKRQFCKDSDGEANGITIESLEKVTNHNGSPAPTDWGKEFERIADLRGKALQYIAQMVDKHGPIELLNPIYQADGSGTYWGEDAPALIYPDTDGLYIHEDDYPEKDQMLTYFEDSIVIEIAAEVQKAITGGDWK